MPDRSTSECDLEMRILNFFSFNFIFFFEVMRNEKREEKAKQLYEREYEKKVEAFYARAQYEQKRQRKDAPSQVSVN